MEPGLSQSLCSKTFKENIFFSIQKVIKQFFDQTSLTDKKPTSEVTGIGWEYGEDAFQKYFSKGDLSEAHALGFC